MDIAFSYQKISSQTTSAKGISLETSIKNDVGYGLSNFRLTQFSENNDNKVYNDIKIDFLYKYHKTHPFQIYSSENLDMTLFMETIRSMIERSTPSKKFYWTFSFEFENQTYSTDEKIDENYNKWECDWFGLVSLESNQMQNRLNISIIREDWRKFCVEIETPSGIMKKEVFQVNR